MAKAREEGSTVASFFPIFRLYTPMPATRNAYYADRFGIRDLELFSGVKAHTIRVWERRYGLLHPDRTDTNIRTYGIAQLKVLLNAALLVGQGESIGAVAALSVQAREARVRGMVSARFDEDAALNELKLAMLTYDELLFDRISERFRTDRGFDALVQKLYLPLLELLGLLWQSSVVCPAQEHFVSNLIRQKIVAAIEPQPIRADANAATCLLFLPENEIHELGLLYLHYLVRRSGRRTIYLGQSVPVEDLVELAQHYKGALEICSVFTVNPAPEEVPEYLRTLIERIDRSDVHFHICGHRIRTTEGLKDSARMKFHLSLPTLAEALLA